MSKHKPPVRQPNLENSGHRSSGRSAVRGAGCGRVALGITASRAAWHRFCQARSNSGRDTPLSLGGGGASAPICSGLGLVRSAPLGIRLAAGGARVPGRGGAVGTSQSTLALLPCPLADDRDSQSGNSPAATNGPVVRQFPRSAPVSPRLPARRARPVGGLNYKYALLTEHPDFTPARLLAAREAQTRGDLDQAIELARKCADDPRTARSALSLLTVAHRQKGDPVAAAETARRLASAPPEEGVADPFHAEVILLRGDPRALSEQAHPLLAAGRLNEAQPGGSPPAGAPGFRRYLAPGRPPAIVAEDLPTAWEQSLRRHVQINPRSAQGVFQLGMVLLAREQWTNAATVLNRPLSLSLTSVRPIITGDWPWPAPGTAWRPWKLSGNRSGIIQSASKAICTSRTSACGRAT